MGMKQTLALFSLPIRKQEKYEKIRLGYDEDFKYQILHNKELGWGCGKDADEQSKELKGSGLKLKMNKRKNLLLHLEIFYFNS